MSNHDIIVIGGSAGSGYEDWVIPSHYRRHPRIQKPVSESGLRKIIGAALDDRA